MAEATLTDQLQTMGRRVGALEDDQSEPDVITRVVKGYGTVKVRCIFRFSTYRFRVCSENLVCSESLVI